MTDDLRLLKRLGVRLDAPDGPPAMLRDRVMAELVGKTTPSRVVARRRWWPPRQWPPAPERLSPTRWLLPTAAVIVVALISVIGGTQIGRAPDSAPAPGAAGVQKVDISVFGNGGSDHMVFESPEELAMAKGITAVFSGEVKDFSQGRVLSSPGLEEKRVVMKVSLSETFKGPRDGGGFAYVELPQPTCAGDVPCATVADFTKAIPAGTRVLVFGEVAAETAPPGGQFADNNAGRPAGAGLVRPDPQGLLFESATATGTTVVGAYEEVENMPEAWRENLSAGIEGLGARLRTARISN